MNTIKTENLLVNESTAAKLLGLRKSTLQRWRWEGRGPRFVKIGSAVRYRPSDIEAYIEAGLRSSTSDSPENRVQSVPSEGKRASSNLTGGKGGNHHA